MTHHLLGDVDGYMLPSVVNRNGVTNHLRQNGGRSGPGLDYLLIAFSVKRFDLGEQTVGNKWPFFLMSETYRFSPYTTADQ